MKFVIDKFSQETNGNARPNTPVFGVALVLNICIAGLLGVAGTAYGDTYEEQLKKGAQTTKQNMMNAPFVKPKNWKTP